MSGPSFYLFGAYFPSWMLCLLVAVVVTLVVRAVFIWVGIDDILPLRLTAYTAMVVTIACAVLLLVYGR